MPGRWRGMGGGAGLKGAGPFLAAWHLLHHNGHVPRDLWSQEASPRASCRHPGRGDGERCLGFAGCLGLGMGVRGRGTRWIRKL